MFGLFRKSHAAGVRSTGRSVLRLEAFEERYQPDAGIVAAVTSQTPAAAPPANQAPQIVNFAAEEMGLGVICLTGQVVAADPSGAVVQFSGSVESAQGLTVTTDADGYFSLIIQLPTDGTEGGFILANTTIQGQASNTASVFVLPSTSP